MSSIHWHTSLQWKVLRKSEMLFLEGKVCRDFNELNEWLLEFSRNQMTEKVRHLFGTEIDHLNILPRRDEAIIGQVHVATVSKHGIVSVNYARYSVPDEFISRQVKVIVSAYDVKIFQISPSVKLVAAHPRVPANSSSILLEHCIKSLVRKPQAMVRWAHKDILFPLPMFKSYYHYLQKLLPYGGAEGEYLKSLNLIQHNSLAELAVAIELVLANKSPEPFADLKSLLTTSGHYPEVIELITDQPPLNTELSIYDSLIPA